MSAKTLPRIVIDTNLATSAEITQTGRPALVLDAWRAGYCFFVTSQELVAEVADVLSRPRLRERYHFSEERTAALVDAMTASIEPVLPIADLPVHCRDAKDDKVLAPALGATADYIVTGDDDLVILDGHPALGSLGIVTPTEFLAILPQRGQA